MKNLNKKSVVLSIIFTLMMLSINLFADTEPNDNYNNAESIPLNSDIVGSLNSSGDRSDMFKITTTVDGRLSLILDKISEMDYKIILYDKDDLDDNGSQLIRWEKRSGNQIDVNLSPDTYYIEITNKTIPDGGGYKFNAKFEVFTHYDIEDNDVKETANILEINQTNYGNLMNRKNGDWDSFDFWQITIPKEGRLTVNDNTELTLQYQILLHDEDVTSSISLENRPKDNSGERMAYNLSAGTYYVEIRKNAGGYFTYGSYTIFPEFIPTKYQDTSEPNDDRENAKNAELNVTVVGTLGCWTNDTWDYRDFWTFTLEKDAKIIINDIPVSTLGYRIGLEKSSGWRFTSINRTISNVETKIEQNLEAGDYVVTLDNQNSSNGTYGSYSLKIETEDQMSIEENNLNSIFTIYPNPVSRNLNIETELGDNFLIELIDTNGQVLLEKTFKNKKAIVNTLFLKSGFYLIRISNEETNEVKKIIVE